MLVFVTDEIWKRYRLNVSNKVMEFDSKILLFLGTVENISFGVGGNNKISFIECLVKISNFYLRSWHPRKFFQHFEKFCIISDWARNNLKSFPDCGAEQILVLVSYRIVLVLDGIYLTVVKEVFSLRWIGQYL